MITKNHTSLDAVPSDFFFLYESGPGFDFIQNCVLSDISEEDMINASQELENIDGYLKPLNQQNFDDFIV